MSDPRFSKKAVSKVKVYTLLPEELDIRLRKVANAKNLSRSEALARAVELWVRSMDPDTEEHDADMLYR